MLKNMDPPLGFGSKCPDRLAYKKLIRHRHHSFIIVVIILITFIISDSSHQVSAVRGWPAKTDLKKTALDGWDGWLLINLPSIVIFVIILMMIGQDEYAA